MANTEKALKLKRAPLRFKPQQGVYAFVDPSPNTKRFAAKLAGLVINQSFKGCAIAVVPQDPIEVGQILRIKLGPLAPIIAEVRWVKSMGDNLFKVGLLFKE